MSLFKLKIYRGTIYDGKKFLAVEILTPTPKRGILQFTQLSSIIIPWYSHFWIITVPFVAESKLLNILR